MPAPTPNEIVSALQSRGINMSISDATGISCLVAGIEDCLNQNYTDQCIIDSIMLWSAILIGASTGGRYITSHRAPSGASQSFGYGTKPWLSLYNQMRLLDTAGCTGDLVYDPSATSKPWFGVVSGRRKCK